MAAGAGRDPGPTELEHEYLIRRTPGLRLGGCGRSSGSSLIVTAIAIGLLVFALISRNQAIHARNAATCPGRGPSRPRRWRRRSEAQESVDPRAGGACWGWPAVADRA